MLMRKNVNNDVSDSPLLYLLCNQKEEKKISKLAKNSHQIFKRQKSCNLRELVQEFFSCYELLLEFT